MAEIQGGRPRGDKAAPKTVLSFAEVKTYTLTYADEQGDIQQAIYAVFGRDRKTGKVGVFQMANTQQMSSTLIRPPKWVLEAMYKQLDARSEPDSSSVPDGLSLVDTGGE